MHVPDLSVCDSLIAREFLSDDDCQVINKTKRNKSKIKRLISILSNSKDPRAAFYALSECIAKTHGHLVEQVRAAADCFPRSDINSNFRRSPVEHDETHTLGCTNDVSHHPEVIYRGAVQHDEETHSLCIPEKQALNSVAQNICSNHEASIYDLHQTIAESSYLDNVNENRDPDNHIHNTSLRSNEPDEHSSNDTFICSPVSENSSQSCIVPINKYTREFSDINTDDKHQFHEHSHTYSDRFLTEISPGYLPSTESTSHTYDHVCDKSRSGNLNDPNVILTNSLQNTNNRISNKIPRPKSHFDNTNSMRRLDYVDGDWLNNEAAIGNIECLDAVDGGINFNDKGNEPVEDLFTISESGKSSINSRLKTPDGIYVIDRNSQFRENSKKDENNAFLSACCIPKEPPVFNSFGDSPPHDSKITISNNKPDTENDANYVSVQQNNADIDCIPSIFHMADSYMISSKVFPDNVETTTHTSKQGNMPPHAQKCLYMSNSNCNKMSSVKPICYESNLSLTKNVKHIPGGIIEVNSDVFLSNAIHCLKPETVSNFSSLPCEESQDFKNVSSVPNHESQNALYVQSILKNESHVDLYSSTDINVTNLDKPTLFNTESKRKINILRDKCQRSTNSNMPVNSLLNSRRAHSQIDHCPSSVLDTPINRVQSWAGSRTRKSWLYRDLSSCSEDYTTTDINSSDLNEVERELCVKLEQSGSITDVVDQLIQEEYLSNDDCNAIKDIQVKRHQAMYVAKRISSVIGDNRCKRFSQLLEYQPKLSEWLSLKFINCDDSTQIASISTKNEIENQTENNSYSASYYSQPHCETKCRMHSSQDSCKYTSSSDSVDSIVTDKEQNQNIIVKMPHVLCPAEIVVDKTFQKVFDALNNEFNKGTLPITTLPRESNTKCIVLYLKACDALYKAEYEDAERFIKLADAAVNDTMCPLFMRSEIFTQKTWLCLRTNRLGLMENLLVENEQFLLANPNLWSNKAVGWFYYDYGRFYVTMVKISKPLQRCRRMKAIHRSVKAYEIYQERAKRCLRKSIDYFSQSNSSDGPIGMGFALSLLASIELQCVSEETISDIIDTTSIQEAEKLLKTVTTLFDDVPGILKATYLQSESDLYLRKGKITEAQATIEEGIALCKELDLKDDLKDSLHKQKLLNRVFHTSAHY